MPNSCRPTRRLVLSTVCVLVLSIQAVSLCGQDSGQPDRVTEWNGFDQIHFDVDGHAAYLVAPKKPATGNPWVWRARFPNYHAEMDVMLLARGYHIAYVDVAGLFGSPKAVEIGNTFYKLITEQRGLNPKPALEGVSRGGLFVYNWAAKNPDKVACIYCDTPVCDIKSWPGGKGNGIGSPPTWQQCLQAYELTEKQAMAFAENPIDHAKTIASARIPLLHIVTENDRVVPPQENSYLLLERLKSFGHPLEIISVGEGTAESNGHHFEHPEPQRVVDFIAKHTQATTASPRQLLEQSKRIVFLGDSITYAGDYVALFDAWVLTQDLKNFPRIINVGLPSETVSGLSEPGHAGGKFPRPDLGERIDRVLETTRPDLVIACYGINCGIYQPFAEQRFLKYKEGLENLKQKVESAGAKLILMTPPTYDMGKKIGKFSYDSVMQRYSTWLLEMRDKGWMVIDLHEPMVQEIARRRNLDPDFTFQPDSVHPNTEGHRFIASRLILGFGGAPVVDSDQLPETLAAQEVSLETQQLVLQRMSLLRDAYLSASGHKRPGIRPGLPLPDAAQKADELTRRILPKR